MPGWPRTPCGTHQGSTKSNFQKSALTGCSNLHKIKDNGSQAAYVKQRVAAASDNLTAAGVPHRVGGGGAAGAELVLSSARLYFAALTYPCTQFFSILLITTCTGCAS